LKLQDTEAKIGARQAKDALVVVVAVDGKLLISMMQYVLDNSTLCLVWKFFGIL
jgi:hypothetical protein